MAATLAAGGVNPVTGARVVDEGAAVRTLSVMATCGMYDYSGEWLLRVGLPLLMPAQLMLAVQASALLWSMSFALYLWRYTPFLLSPRADGQPG